jgi:hypothetical protein
MFGKPHPVKPQRLSRNDLFKHLLIVSAKGAMRFGMIVGDIQQTKLHTILLTALRLASEQRIAG